MKLNALSLSLSLSLVDVWGLDTHGDFLHNENRIVPITNKQEEEEPGLISVWSNKLKTFIGSLFKKKKQEAAADLIMTELQHLRQQYKYRDEKNSFSI